MGKRNSAKTGSRQKCAHSTRDGSEANPTTSSKPTLVLPGNLAEAVQTGRCVLFLGAGASREADGPSWRRLIDDIAHKRVATVSEFLTVGFSHAGVPNSKRASSPEVPFLQRRTRGQEGADRGYQLNACGARGELTHPVNRRTFSPPRPGHDGES